MPPPAHHPPVTRPDAPPAVLVLGTSRSGALALAAMIQRLGGAPPDGWNGARALAEVNDELLAVMGLDGDELPADEDFYATPAAAGLRARARVVIEEELGASSLAVLADLRLGRALPFWQEALAEAGRDLRVILVHGHPLDEVSSDPAPAADGAQATLAWLRAALESEAASRGVRRAFMSRDRLLADPRGVARRLGEDLGLAWAEPDADLHPVLAPGLGAPGGSNRPRWRSAGVQDLLTPLHSEVLAVLERWAEVGEDPRDRPMLDRARGAFDAAQPRNPLQDVERAGRAPNQRAAEPPRLARHAADADDLRARLAVRTRERDEARAALAEASRDRLRGALAQRSLETEEATAALGALGDRMASLEAELAATRTSLASSEAYAAGLGTAVEEERAGRLAALRAADDLQTKLAVRTRDLAVLKVDQGQRLREALAAGLLAAPAGSQGQDAAQAKRLTALLAKKDAALRAEARKRQDLEARLGKLDSRLRDVLSSTSWRLTSPVRRVTIALRGLRR